nr:MAG TPA: hypothetical protein [Caudoviricetes sp.]
MFWKVADLIFDKDKLNSIELLEELAEKWET